MCFTDGAALHVRLNTMSTPHRGASRQHANGNLQNLHREVHVELANRDGRTVYPAAVLNVPRGTVYDTLETMNTKRNPPPPVDVGCPGETRQTISLIFHRDHPRLLLRESVDIYTAGPERIFREQQVSEPYEPGPS